MATAAHRGGAAHGAVLRCARAAVITLVAVLAVLVHHETAATVTHVPPPGASAASGLAGMHHSPASALPPSVMPPSAMPPPVMHPQPNGRTASPGVTTPAATDDRGACSGTAAQHCSAAGVDSVQLAPPHQSVLSRAPAVRPGAAVGRDVPGTTGRAPPDLSVLSRLLL
jgi:hypothetical protein